MLARHAGAAPDELLAHLDAALTDFQVGAQADDTAVIALRRQPSATQRSSGLGRSISSLSLSAAGVFAR